VPYVAADWLGQAVRRLPFEVRQAGRYLTYLRRTADGVVISFTDVDCEGQAEWRANDARAVRGGAEMRGLADEDRVMV